MAYVERCRLYVQNTIITASPFGLCLHTREAVEKSWNHNQSDKNSLAGNLTAPT